MLFNFNENILYVLDEFYILTISICIILKLYK